jgi:hypothetical protein
VSLKTGAFAAQIFKLTTAAALRDKFQDTNFAFSMAWNFEIWTTKMCL